MSAWGKPHSLDCHCLLLSYPALWTFQPSQCLETWVPYGWGGGEGWWRPIILQTDKYTYRHWCSIGWKRHPYLCLDKDKLAPLSLWAGQKTFAFANERLSKARHQTPQTDLENRTTSSGYSAKQASLPFSYIHYSTFIKKITMEAN